MILHHPNTHAPTATPFPAIVSQLRSLCLGTAYRVNTVFCCIMKKINFQQKRQQYKATYCLGSVS